MIDEQKTQEMFHHVMWELTIKEQLRLIELLAKNVREFD